MPFIVFTDSHANDFVPRNANEFVSWNTIEYVLRLLTGLASVCKFISAFLIAGIFRCDSELSLEPFVTPSRFSDRFRS